MDLKTDFTAAAQRAETPVDRRAESDRRAYADRRRSGGLFEVRARRDAAGYDRRQGERRERMRSWLAPLGRWRRQV